MDLLKRLVIEEDGQGLVEYTLIVVLVAPVFWLAIKNTDIGDSLASGAVGLYPASVLRPSCDSAS